MIGNRLVARRRARGWIHGLTRIVALDARSLALMRIGVGGILLADLAVRAGDLRAHYTDFGILPRAELGLYTWRTVWTLHGLASPWPAAVAALFALAALCAVALLLGWRTRLATFASWLLLTSLQYRNPALVHGGDVLLRMLLFWGLFLPLGARFSLDARRVRPRPLPTNRHVSVAGAALLVQVALVYAFSVANRTGPTWWDGRALADALHFDLFATGLAINLREYESLLAPMTHAAIWFEALGPLLLLAPVATGPIRTLAVVLFLGFHATLGALFHLGIFPVACAVAWIGLLPTWFWERITRGSEDVQPVWPRMGAGDALAGAALVLVVLANFAGLRHDPTTPRADRAWELPAQWIYVDQVWGLFAPDPPVYDGWYVVMGVRADGARVDPFWRRDDVSFAKPAVLSATMNIRWREFFFRLQRDRRDPRWASFGSWLCRAWNEDHSGPERLDRAYVYFVEETTGRLASKIDGTLTLMAHECEPAPALGAVREGAGGR
jgi:hypothetical protein